LLLRSAEVKPLFQRFVQLFCWTFLFFCCWSFTWGLVFWTLHKRWLQVFFVEMGDEKAFPSFAVSTWAPSSELLPQCGTLYIPPLFLAEPKMSWTGVGHQFLGALSGKRGFGAMRVENGPSFGCLITFLLKSTLWTFNLCCSFLITGLYPRP